MVWPPITSMSSAQADGQSCGQVECLMSTLACWFMPKQVTSNALFAEGVYPQIPQRNPRVSHALRTQISSAIGVDRLPVDVAGGWAAEESHGGGDIFRPASLAGDGLVGQVMCRFRLVFRSRRADQPGNDAIHGDAIGGEVVGERAGEADDSRLRRHHMGTIFRPRMRAQPADIDDGPCPGFTERRKTRLHAMKCAIEGDIEDLAPRGVVHCGEGLFGTQRRVVDENIDAAELLYGRLRHRLYRLGISYIADVHQRLAARCLDLPYDALGLGAVAARINDDRRANLGQRQRDRTADVAAGPGDDSYFARELPGHQPLSPQR